jgi:hypothetical protein
MSVAHLIDEARNLSHYEGNTLVIFDRPANDIRLTLEWDVGSERWRGTCSDESHSQTYLAPVSTAGGDDVMAVAGALNAYLDAINGTRSQRDRVDAGNAWARERIAFHTQR